MEKQLPLEYWAIKSFELPILPQVAWKAFSIPATSAKLERMFSTKKGRYHALTVENCFQEI